MFFFRMRPLIIALLALPALLVGCSNGSGGRTACETDDDCSTGKYCGKNKTCISECKKNSDCTSDKVCNDRGKCVVGDQDGGTFDTGVSDGIPLVDTPPAVDQPPSTSDTKPWTGDTKPWTGDTKPWTTDTKPWTTDLKITPDKKPWTTDQAVPSCVSSLVGKACTKSGGECGNQMTCLLTSDTVGFCTCDCTVDDESTTLTNEDSCPDLARQVCTVVELTSGTYAICMKKCSPKLGSNDCDSPLACDPRSGGYFGLFDDAVCAIPGCTSDSDCYVATATKCSVASNNCTSPAKCITFAGGDEGRCALPGKCDTASGLCTNHTHGKSTAKIGDPCKDDTECAGSMRCMSEYDQNVYEKAAGQTCTYDDDCCSGTCTSGKCAAGAACYLKYRNGYCVMTGCQFASTLTSRACPTGSSCNTLYLGGMCQKTCDQTVASTCRGNTLDKKGDYECIAWNNLSISTAPVCDFGMNLACSFLQTTSGTLSCANLGTDKTAATNPTNMTCRKPDGTVLTNKWDPAGYCYDNTASGN